MSTNMRRARGAATLIAVAAVVAPAAAADPFAHWMLSEPGGSVAIDEVGGFDGAYVGSPEFRIPGPVEPCGDTAVRFDGISDHVAVGDVADGLDIGEDSFTIVTRFRKASDSTALMKLVNKGATIVGSPPNAGYQVRIRDGILEFGVRVRDGDDQFARVEIPEPAVGQWHFLACVYDRAAPAVRIYLNPVNTTPTAEQPAPPLDAINTNINFAIGALDRRPFGIVSEHFLGDIDGVSLYRAALSGSEVLALAQPEPCFADLADPQGLLDLADITLFVSSFAASAGPADLVPPCDLLDLADVSAFVSSFLQGCP